MSQENTLTTPQATIPAPTVAYKAPKNTLATEGIHGIADVQVKDGNMLHLLADLGKHTPFTNSKGDVETIIKVSGVKYGKYTVNLTVKQENEADALRKQAKNISDKLKKFARGKANDEDIKYLLGHGFANEAGNGLDVGKCEAVYADILAKQAKETASKAFKKMAENNGSLQANAAKA